MNITLEIPSLSEINEVARQFIRNMGESTVFIEFMLSVIKQALLEVREIPAITSSNSKTNIRLLKILDFLETHEYIMNNDVQKILGVSSATATRILTNFAKTGELKRIRIESHWGYTK